MAFTPVLPPQDSSQKWLKRRGHGKAGKLRMVSKKRSRGCLMKNARLMILVLVCVIALTGTAYAAWQQNITVSGQATTGSLYVQMQQPALAGGQLIVNGLSKDICNAINGVTMDISAANDPAGSDGGNDDYLNINVDNAYPGWLGVVAANVKNVGTVPATIGAPLPLKTNSLSGAQETTLEENVSVTSGNVSYGWEYYIQGQSVTVQTTNTTQTGLVLQPGQSATMQVAINLEDIPQNQMGQQNWFTFQWQVPYTQAT
jgi:hypothetical protein